MNADRNTPTYVLFYCLGIVTVIPSYFFTTPATFWFYKFRNLDNADTDFDNDSNDSNLHKSFLSRYQIIANVINAVCMTVIVHLTVKYNVPMVGRLIVGLVVLIGLFLALTILAVADTDAWQDGFYGLALTLGALLQLNSCMLIISVYQLVIKFPLNFMVAIISGAALGGVLSSLTEILALTIDSDRQVYGMIYFIMGLAFVVLCLVGLVLSLRFNAFFRINVERKFEPTKLPIIDKTFILNIFKKIYLYMLALTFVAIISIVHPAITSLIKAVNFSKENKWTYVYFRPVVTYLFFYTSNYVGRELSAVINRPKNAFILNGISIARVLLIPLIVLYANNEILVDDANRDWFYVLYILVLGFSDGYLINFCVFSASSVTDENQRKLTSIIMLMFMNLVLALAPWLNVLILHFV